MKVTTSRTSLAFLLALGLSHGLATAAVISVNYDIPDNASNGTIIGAAGVVSVANWNAVSVLAPAGPFIDSEGASTTLGISLSGGGMDSWNTGGTADEQLYSDWVNLGTGARTLSLTGITYATYDLYIYHSHYAANETVSYTIGALVENLNATGIGNPPSQNPVHQEGHTYVLFQGLTGDISVVIDALSGDAGLAGFQIVDTTSEPIPEPSSALAGLAIGLLVLRRQRRA